MPLALTYDELKALEPCSDDWTSVSALLGGETGWNGKRIDAATARAAGCSFNDLVCVASAVARYDADVARRLRLWAADCAARVLHIYEKSETSKAPRNAIIAARAFARGEIDNAAWTAAWAAAWDTAWDTARASAAWSAACAAACAAASDAAWCAAWSSARASDARSTEKSWQFDRLIERLSENEPDDWPLPEVETR